MLGILIVAAVLVVSAVIVGTIVQLVTDRNRHEHHERQFIQYRIR